MRKLVMLYLMLSTVLSPLVQIAQKHSQARTYNSVAYTAAEPVSHHNHNHHTLPFLFHPGLWTYFLISITVSTGGVPVT